MKYTYYYYQKILMSSFFKFFINIIFINKIKIINFINVFFKYTFKINIINFKFFIILKNIFNFNIIFLILILILNLIII